MDGVELLQPLDQVGFNRGEPASPAGLPGPKVLHGDCSDYNCNIPPGGKDGRSLVAHGSLRDSGGCWDARHLLHRTGDVLGEIKKHNKSVPVKARLMK